jgi:glutamine cyclotransferase
MQIRNLILISSSLLWSCNSNTNQPESETETIQSGIPAPQIINLNIMAAYPHDDSAYTQGLELHNRTMYEGTGDFINSSIRVTDYKTGKVNKKHAMGSENIFGEGITIFKNKIYQLTWQSNQVYVYDVKDISKVINTFNWPREGWGITHYKDQLIVSDGSANIYFVNPDNFSIITQKQVTDNFGPVANLNELEIIDGYLYANVYTQDYIVKIDLANGHVVGKINLPGLIKQYAPNFSPREGEVLNGIAYDSISKRIFITGKRWPKLFEAAFQ